MLKKPAKGARRAFVLDTNVLMHDPAAVFRFEEHDIYLPMGVLEELDAGKKGLSESARNVRQVSRFLDELMANATKEQIDKGLELPTGRSGNHGKKPPTGRLFFQTRRLAAGLPDTLPGQGIDNALLGYTLALQMELPGTRVTLVSKDINLRIKAAILGVHAEDYYNDRTIEDADLLLTGVCLPTSGRRTGRTSSPGTTRRAPTTACAARWCANGIPTSSCSTPATTASRRSCARSRRRSQRSRSRRTSAASDTPSGESRRGTASRTSPSTCCSTPTSTS
jgi:hypothetical protein